MSTAIAKLIDVEKAVAVIEAEHKLVAGDFVESCENPGRCAVGALLFAAGMSNEDLGLLDAPEDWNGTGQAVGLLWNNYGIRPYHANEIVAANDRAASVSTIAERRARVVERIRDLANAQRADPSRDAARCDDFDDPEPPDDDDYSDYDGY